MSIVKKLNDNLSLGAFVLRVMRFAGLLTEQKDAQGRITGYAIASDFIGSIPYQKTGAGEQTIQLPAGIYFGTSIVWLRPYKGAAIANWHSTDVVVSGDAMDGVYGCVYYINIGKIFSHPGGGDL